MRYEMLTTGFKLHLVDGLTALGEIDEALSLVDETTREVEVNGNLYYMPEALRIRGRVFLAMPEPWREDAEICFNKSLDWSRRQSARSWELRATTDLAALWATEGQGARARALLHPLLETFVEGLDTADLQVALHLLTKLQ